MLWFNAKSVMWTHLPSYVCVICFMWKYFYNKTVEEATSTTITYLCLFVYIYVSTHSIAMIYFGKVIKEFAEVY